MYQRSDADNWRDSSLMQGQSSDFRHYYTPKYAPTCQCCHQRIRTCGKSEKQKIRDNNRLCEYNTRKYLARQLPFHSIGVVAFATISNDSQNLRDEIKSLKSKLALVQNRGTPANFLHTVYAMSDPLIVCDCSVSVDPIVPPPEGFQNECLQSQKNETTERDAEIDSDIASQIIGSLEFEFQKFAETWYQLQQQNIDVIQSLNTCPYIEDSVPGYSASIEASCQNHRHQIEIDRYTSVNNVLMEENCVLRKELNVLNLIQNILKTDDFGSSSNNYLVLESLQSSIERITDHLIPGSSVHSLMFHTE